MRNLETIDMMYQLLAKDNIEETRKIFDKDLIWNTMEGFHMIGGSCKGIDAVYKKVFRYYKEYWTDWKAINDRAIESVDSVILFGHYEGTYKATGKFVRAPYVSEYRIKDGKITRYDQYTDTLLIAYAVSER